MAIEFTHKGKKWRADTAREAIALRRALEAADERVNDPNIQIDLSWDEDLAYEVLKALGQKQRRFLQVLTTADEVTSAQVVKAMKLDSEVALAGILSGLSKQAGKESYKAAEIFVVRVTWEGKKKTRSFRLNKDFKQSAQVAGWPHKWV